MITEEQAVEILASAMWTQLTTGSWGGYGLEGYLETAPDSDEGEMEEFLLANTAAIDEGTGLAEGEMMRIAEENAAPWPQDAEE